MGGVESADDGGRDATVAEEADDSGRYVDRSSTGSAFGTRSSTRDNERASVRASSRLALEQYGAAVDATRGRTSTPRDACTTAPQPQH